MSTAKQLPGDERLPLYSRLTDALREAIAKGTWQPGDRLPSERELAAEFGVAAGTMRQALGRLVDERILERQHGRGTFVRRPAFASSLFRFFRFEPRDGQAPYPDARVLSRKVCRAPKLVAEQLDLAPRSRVIHLSRLRLLDGAAVLAEEIWLPHDLFAALVELPAEALGPLLYPAYEQHCAHMVARADETLTVEPSDASRAALLEVPIGTPLIAIERLARDHHGTPLEWRRTYGRAERFRYRTEIR